MHSAWTAGRAGGTSVPGIELNELGGPPVTAATTPFANREQAHGYNGIVKIGTAAALALRAPRHFVKV